jgi:hypothetical protein
MKINRPPRRLTVDRAAAMADTDTKPRPNSSRQYFTTLHYASRLFTSDTVCDGLTSLPRSRARHHARWRSPGGQNFMPWEARKVAIHFIEFFSKLLNSKDLEENPNMPSRATNPAGSHKS